MQFEKHICSLLYRFDCVIIPGLGGFVANHAPARLSTEQQLSMPPSKGIIFNKNLVNNDGLLADAIAQAEKISYAEANAFIEKFVLSCKEKLFRGDRVEFEELGVLYADSEKNIQFRPDFSVNFLVESFGLYPVVARELVKSKVEIEQPKEKETPVIQFQPREEESQKQKKEKEDQSEPDIHQLQPVIRRSTIRKYWPAAAAVLLPIAFYSVWIPLRTDFLQTGHLSFGDLNPFRQNNPVYVERAALPAFETEADISEWNTLVENAGGPVAKLEIASNGSYLNIAVVPEIKPVAETTYVDRTDYLNKEHQLHIVGGCFQELANAEKLVAELRSKGHPAYILDQVGGLNRVVIESFGDEASANAALSQLRSSGNPSAWLLKK